MKKKIATLTMIFILFISLTSCNLATQLFCDHDYVVIETQDATCTERGYEKSKCSKCGFILTTYTQALGHDYVETSRLEPECDKSGLVLKKCSHCGDEITVTLEKLGHDIVDAIETINGVTYITHKCSRCDYYTEPTPLSSVMGSTYGYEYLGTDPVDGKSKQSLYTEMMSFCDIFSKSTTDLAPESVSVTTSEGKVSQDYYIIGKPNPSSYGLTTDQAISVWKTLILDNPGYYWLSNAILYNSSGTMFYVTITDMYASYEFRHQVDASIENMVVNVGANITSSMSEVQKFKVIHDYVCSKTTYAYLSDGKTASTRPEHHNLTGVSYYGTGVCEAYSEAFSFLCARFGLQAILVTGTAQTGSSSGEHEWNYIKAGNEWYAVDCTWDDSSDRLRYDYFGVGNNILQSIYSDHTPDCQTVTKTFTSYQTTYTLVEGMKYIYDLPELSHTKLSS